MRVSRGVVDAGPEAAPGFGAGAAGRAGSDAGPWVEELTPAPDPLACAELIRGLPYPVLLDSAVDPVRLGRFSFLTADPVAVITGKNGRTTLHDPAAGDGRVVAEDPLHLTRTLLAPHRRDPVPGLPPFQGGAAGYVGYEYGAWLERLPSPRFDDLDIPDVTLGIYDWVLAWDHEAGRAWLIATGIPERDPPARAIRARSRLEAIRTRLDGPPLPAAAMHRPASAAAAPGERAPGERAPSERAPSHPVPGHPALRSSFARDEYLAAVARVRDYIHAGDIFQANLSQRLEASYAGDPWSLYRALRVTNPAPFAAYLEAPGLAIASASPERFIRADVDGRVETRPIKGTSPRGIGPEHDAHLARALTESEKDRAENLMIVDLLRNDLSRVCRPGTVRAPELFALEHYSTVHHLVSTVVGTLADGVDAFDLLRAAFPGGSITGAPKVRAMEIIAELEPSRRGVYCGAIGYASVTGAADSSVVIRTYLVRHGRAYFSVGGGIVADSEPESEYQETLDKARALIAALGMTDAGDAGHSAAGRGTGGSAAR